MKQNNDLKLETWKPAENLANNYFIETTVNVAGALHITMFESIDQNKEIRVVFKDSVMAYRDIDESFRISTTIQLGKKHNDQFYKWSFFKVSGSPYLKYLSGKFFDATETQSLTHYLIGGINFYLDIIADNNVEVQVTHSQKSERK